VGSREAEIWTAASSADRQPARQTRFPSSGKSCRLFMPHVKSTELVLLRESSRFGGEPKRFRPLIELYREAGRRAGHSPERLTVGLHSVGFLADTTEEAAEIFFPGYAHTFTEIGKERGWPAATRVQFDALRGPTGALLIGDSNTVAKKILCE
jgi:hypothetical protein